MDTEKYLYDGKIIKDEHCKIGYVNQFSKSDKNQDLTVFEFLSEKFVENLEVQNEICAKMAEAEDLTDLFEVYQKTLDEKKFEPFYLEKHHRNPKQLQKLS